MYSKTLIITLTILSVFLGCKNQSNRNQNRLTGLWVVQKVKVGDQEMTPNARWTRFNADSTQQSGNGWYQHTHGTWSLDESKTHLSIENENGQKDPFGAFDVKVELDKMQWKRTEEGQQVEVMLERANELPATYADNLMGLWQLESHNGTDQYLNDSTTLNSLFLRWDRKYVVYTNRGRIFGVYNVHGHKPELELIPYSKELERNFWTFEYVDDSFSMKLLNTDSTITRNFIRTDEFPQ